MAVRIIEYKHPCAARCMEKPLVLCLGFFDGVHLGHRALIADTVRRAEELGLEPAVFTFPAESMGLKRGVPRLYTTEEKLAIFEELGVSTAVLCDFSSVSSLSPREFVERVLSDELNVRFAVAGEDFRFGHRALGDSATLRAEMQRCGGDAFIHTMEHFDFPDGRVEISASLIREYLSCARPERAAALLGAPYTVRATAVRGDGRGHVFGYPTVNTELPEDSPLARGVYRTEIEIGGVGYVGLTNVGSCPTFGERTVHAETFILDFDGDVYGESVAISFLAYIREERSFPSADALRREIKKNVSEVLKETRGGK